jgi:hypothetical protein
MLDTSVIPLRAREFLKRLRDASFDRASFVAGNLQSLLNKPAEVSRRRRLASLFLAPGICLLICGTMETLILRAWNKSDPKFRTANPAHAQLADAVRLYAECKGKEISWLEFLSPGIGKSELGDSVGKWTAYRFGDFILDPKFDEMASDLREDERKMARKIAKEYDRVTQEEFAAIDKEVGPAVSALQEYIQAFIVMIGPGAFAFLLIGIGIVNILAVVIFGTSLGLRLFGLAVIDRTGTPVSRGHHLLRNMIAFVPLGIGIFGIQFYLLKAFLPKTVVDGSVTAILLSLALLLTLAIGAAFIVTAILRPNGGWYDRLAGTRVVLR